MRATTSVPLVDLLQLTPMSDSLASMDAQQRWCDRLKRAFANHCRLMVVNHERCSEAGGIAAVTTMSAYELASSSGVSMVYVQQLIEDGQIIQWTVGLTVSIKDRPIRPQSRRSETCQSATAAKIRRHLAHAATSLN